MAVMHAQCMNQGHPQGVQYIHGPRKRGLPHRLDSRDTDSQQLRQAHILHKSKYSKSFYNVRIPGSLTELRLFSVSICGKDKKI